MEIKILGTRGKIKSKAVKHSNHSGILIDDKILIDVGEKSFLKHKPTYILFTHLHPDHAWFIETNEFFDYPAEVYSPEKSYLIKNYSVKTDPFFIDDYEIIPVPTIHSMKVKSQGYVIKKRDKKIFYSGDMVWIEKQYLPLLENLDLVITDGSFIRKGGAIRRQGNQIFGHNGIPDLIKFFSRFTHRILFVHFGSWFMENVAESKKKILALQLDGLNIEVGYDGQELVV
jgi:ribonuclease BN (tRNA processing enzyme)